MEDVRQTGKFTRRPLPGTGCVRPSRGLCIEILCSAAEMIWIFFLVAGCCCWLLVAGCWLLVAGCWLLVAGCWLLVAGCWLLVAGCWLLVAGCWLLVAGRTFSTSGSPVGL